jgi:PAS domain S-box-containing protein
VGQTTTETEPKHYLQRELYELMRADSAIFDFIQNGSLDGIWYWDVLKPEHEWMSPRFWETFGYDPATKRHLAQEWQDIINKDDLDTALRNFAKHCEDPRHPYDQIVRYQHANGTTVAVRCRGIAIRDEAGRAIRMLGAHTDVTALVQTEAELRRRTAELERSNHELEQFAYIASHDLKEPIRVVTSFARLIQSELAEPTPDKAHLTAMLQHLEAGASRLTTVVDGLLAYARIAGPTVALVDSIDANAVMAEIVADLAVLIEESRATVFVGELPTIAFNRVQLRQVLQNLVQNALKYRREEPTRVVVDATRIGDAWVFSIEDEGVGIDARYYEPVFQIFRRLHGADTPGTGLGLALCKKIVEARGGRIWLESEVGVGSTFSFSVPDAVDMID